MTASATSSQFTVTDVDGVPTVWSSLPGPFTAGLIVRMGSADETLANSGVSHLLEHLALFGLGRPGDHANAFVDQTMTMFHCTGDEPEVTGFLDGLTRQLVSPPVERLSEEREVLRSEYAQRGTSAERTLLTWRYGAVSYGVSSADGLGLGCVTPERLTAWSHRYATRNNAVLWLSGPPPAGLRLNLPDGPPMPAPDPWWTVLPQLPAYVATSEAVVALHAVVERGYVNQALAELLQWRLIDELRTRRAVSYSPQVNYRPLTGDASRLLVVSDLVPGRQSDGVRSFLGELHDLADGVLTDEEISRWRITAVRDLERTRDEVGRLPGLAWQLLFGRPLEQHDEVVAQLEAIKAQEVVARAAEALSSAVALIPRAVRTTREPWVPAPVTTLEPMTGTVHRHLEAADGTGPRLIVGDAGITWQDGESGHLTVTRETAVAVRAWPDGARAVHGSDANVVMVEPTMWENGRAIVDRIDQMLPPDLVMAMPRRPVADIPSPRPSQVASAGPTSAGPAGLPTAVPRRGPSSFVASAPGLVLAGLLAAVFIVASVALGHAAPLLPAVAIGVSAYLARRDGEGK